MNVQGWHNRLVTVIISLCGSILLGGLLISTVSNIIERRVEAVRTGMVTYKNLSQHFVIIGFCDITASLIIEICKENPGADIILLSSQETESVRYSIQSQLDNEDEKRVKNLFWQH